MKSTTIKIISSILVFVLILNLILFGLGILGVMEFWIIIGIGGLFAYRYLGWLKKE